MNQPLSIGHLALPGNLFLAPVAGFTTRAFRSVCAELGADFSYTELASSEALVRSGFSGSLNHIENQTENQNSRKPKFQAIVNLLRRAENEKSYGIQLFGANPEIIYRAVLLLKEFKPSLVDINCGCPVPKVVKTGAGSALMKTPELLGQIVKAAVKASGENLGGVPVTVKIRSGWDSDSVNFRECALTAVEAGASLVCLHPRTRAQGYSGKSDWNHIAELVFCLPVPVAGSGDLFSPEDAGRMLRETGCAAVMFARGAIGNPFIFKQTKNYFEKGNWEEAPLQEKFAMAFRQLELLASDIGEKSACLEMRKVFAAFSKGLAGKPGIPGSARLRNRLVQAGTISEYHSIIEDGVLF